MNGGDLSSIQGPAYEGEFLRGVIGSTVHGLHVPGTDDLDLMGVMVESPTEALGMGKRFEQHTWRTQPEGHPSGPGDIDLTVYGLHKFMRLAAAGNPTILNLLFVPADRRWIDTELADQLRSLTGLIVSREAGARYRGYMYRQLQRLLGEAGQKHTGENRKKYYVTTADHPDPWDSKYALHMLRLGIQGVELLKTGHITLPMGADDVASLKAVRAGEVRLDACVSWAHGLMARLDDLAATSPLPEHPNRETLDEWVVATYLNEWRRKGLVDEARMIAEFGQYPK